MNRIARTAIVTLSVCLGIVILGMVAFAMIQLRPNWHSWLYLAIGVEPR